MDICNTVYEIQNEGITIIFDKLWSSYFHTFCQILWDHNINIILFAESGLWQYKTLFAKLLTIKKLYASTSKVLTISESAQITWLASGTRHDKSEALFFFKYLRKWWVYGALLFLRLVFKTRKFVSISFLVSGSSCFDSLILRRLLTPSYASSN